MKSNSRIHKIDGIELGECLELMAHSDEEFVLTVIEPEYYGDSRQAASMALTRTQLHELISSTLIALYETGDQTSD